MKNISPILNIMIKATEKASKVLIRDFGELENLQVTKRAQRILLLTLIKKLKKFLLKNYKNQEKIFLF